ncbi:MAG: hypothetical protein ACON38_04470 [Akkermansiaceae bacterium]
MFLLIESFLLWKPVPFRVPIPRGLPTKTLPGESSHFASPCMKLALAKEIIACLPAGRTLFHYTKDDYAFLLLDLMRSKTPRLHELRRSRVGRLLEKPTIKSFLSQCPSGDLSSADLPRRQYHRDGRAYRLSLDLWGEDLDYWKSNQVSRKGVSLVLQLNMPQSHFRRLQRCLIDPDDTPFDYYSHPTRNDRNPTLAWCRLDVDLDSREALIEEIQTDMLRDYREAMSDARTARKKGERIFDWYGFEFRTNHLIYYWDDEFSSHEKTWHEAILTAALEFLVDELGMKTIYYHTAESGRILKRISGNTPPVSLYSSLPKKFCFEQTAEAPDILSRESHWKRRLRSSPRPFEFFRLAV